MRVRKAILKALKSHEGPMTVDQILAGPAKGFPHTQVRDTLRHLVSSGHIVERPKGQFTALPARNSATGRLTVNPRGYGFVATPAGDVYIGGTDMHGAMHNDIVTIRIYQHPGKATTDDKHIGRFCFVAHRFTSLVCRRPCAQPGNGKCR